MNKLRPFQLTMLGGDEYAQFTYVEFLLPRRRRKMQEIPTQNG